MATTASAPTKTQMRSSQREGTMGRWNFTRFGNVRLHGRQALPDVTALMTAIGSLADRPLLMCNRVSSQRLLGTLSGNEMKIRLHRFGALQIGSQRAFTGLSGACQITLTLGEKKPFFKGLYRW